MNVCETDRSSRSCTGRLRECNSGECCCRWALSAGWMWPVKQRTAAPQQRSFNRLAQSRAPCRMLSPPSGKHALPLSSPVHPSQSADNLQTLCHACMAHAMSADAFACILWNQLLVMVFHIKRLAVQDGGLVCENHKWWSACHAAILCMAGVR